MSDDKNGGPYRTLVVRDVPAGNESAAMDLWEALRALGIPAMVDRERHVVRVTLEPMAAARLATVLQGVVSGVELAADLGREAIRGVLDAFVPRRPSRRRRRIP